MRPMILLTMSSSGGKWLASTVAKHLPECRYYDKEFFNPWCNSKYEVRLRHNFGCEQAACYRNIARAGDEYLHGDIEATWGREQYTFTKEVFSAFKAEALMLRFDIVGLVRRTEDCLPPKRSNVWNCYEHTWMALHEAGFDVREQAGRHRAVEAHRFIRKKIMEDSVRLGFPLIEFDALQDTSAADLHDLLGRAFGFVSRDMVEEVLATRFRER